MKKLPNWVVLITSIVIAQLAGGVGSLGTNSASLAWYAGLNRPGFAPPNWLFGPVWILLYTAMGIAAYLIWKSKGKEKHRVLDLYAVHLVVNAFWSIFFFSFRLPILALIDIVVLWTMIAVLTFKFYDINKTAGYLFIPYLIWVTFASFLNLSIVFLN